MSAAVADRRLHPSALVVGFLRKVPEFAIGLPALIGFTTENGALYVFPIIGAGLAVALGAALFSWLRFRYGVGERDIVIESGVFQRQRRIIPFDRVQDIDIEQRLLARLFGTVTVRIETGGSGKDEGRLDAVALDEAHRLRALIRERSAAVPASEDEGERPDEPLLFEMSFPRLLLAGFFNFSLLYLAVLGALFENLHPYFDWEAIDPGELLEPAGAVANEITVLRTAALVGLLLLLGSITGIVLTVAKNYGFRLTRSGLGLKRVRGLLTRTEIVLPLRRIQLAKVRTGLIGGLLGWRSLDYQTLSGDALQSGGQTAVPFGRMEEIMPVLEETGHADLPAPDAFIRVSRLSIARRAVRVLLPFAVLVAALSFQSTAWLLALPLFPLLVGLSVVQWKRHRYAFTDRTLVVSRGVFERSLWIIPFERTQTIGLARSPLQRWLGLTTVEVDTAGASLLNQPAIVDLEARDAEAIAARLVALQREARARLKQA